MTVEICGKISRPFGGCVSENGNRLHLRSKRIVRNVFKAVNHTLTVLLFLSAGAAIAADGVTAASGGKDRVIRMWNMASGQMVRSLPKQAQEIRAALGRFRASGKFTYACPRGVR